MNDANEGHRRRLPGAHRGADETPSDEALTHTGIRLPRGTEPEPDPDRGREADRAARLPGDHQDGRPAEPQQPAAAPGDEPSDIESTHQIPTVGDTTPSPVVADEETPSRRGGLAGFARETAIVVTVALVISFLVKTFLAQPFWIPSGSMNDTLVRGDRVIVSKLTPGPIDLDRGDVVVFEDPGGWLPTQPQERGPLLKGLEFVGLYPAGDNHLIKRVIGLPGDKVACCDDQDRVTVNGTPLEEPYLREGDQPSAEKFSITVPSDKVWVMGDHRADSSDSRFHDDGSGRSGSVPIDGIIGRAVTIVWPLDRLGWLSDHSSTFDKVAGP